jgi:Sec-independent protein translocase protein TatA
MNVPEALKATQHAVGTFRKAVAIAEEELETEMRRIHSELLEERAKDEVVERSREDEPLRHRRGDY